MKLSKKALTIIDSAQYRAYGMGYAQAVEDMQAWLTDCLPGVVMSQLMRMGRDAAKSLEAMNRSHYEDVSDAARRHVAMLHESLGVVE